jgi:hypothetical protein
MLPCGSMLCVRRVLEYSPSTTFGIAIPWWSTSSQQSFAEVRPSRPDTSPTLVLLLLFRLLQPAAAWLAPLGRNTVSMATLRDRKKEGFLKEKVQLVDGTCEWDERFFSLDYEHRCLVVSMAVDDGSTTAERLAGSDLSLVNLWGGDAGDDNFDLLLTNGVLRSLRGQSREDSRLWCQAIEELIHLSDSSNAPAVEASSAVATPKLVGSGTGSRLSGGGSFGDVSRFSARGASGGGGSSSGGAESSRRSGRLDSSVGGELGSGDHAERILHHLSQLSQSMRTLAARDGSSLPPALAPALSSATAAATSHSTEPSGGRSHSDKDQLGQLGITTNDSVTASETGGIARAAGSFSSGAHGDKGRARGVVHGNRRDADDDSERYYEPSLHDAEGDNASAPTLLEQLNSSLHEMQVATRKVR